MASDILLLGTALPEADIHALHLWHKKQSDEIAALRSKLRALSAPLPSDPDGRMWSTLGYFANREGDDLDTEVMGWAMSAIAALRSRVAELEAALERLGSMQAMTVPHFIAAGPTGDELKARAEYARRALDGGGNG
jgi:hypothetical protein